MTSPVVPVVPVPVIPTPTPVPVLPPAPLPLPTDDYSFETCVGARVIGAGPWPRWRLAIRSGPGQTFPQVAELLPGQPIEICALYGNWARLPLGGWAYAGYIEMLP